MPAPSIETAIAQLILDTKGDEVGNRVHIAHRPQKDLLPSIVVRLNDYGDQPNIENNETHVESRIAVECFADSYNGAYVLDQLVRDIGDFTGEIICIGSDGSTEYGRRTIDVICAEDTTTDETPPPDGSDQRTYSRSTLFFVLAHK